MTLGFVAIAVVTGTLIGMVGIGGILLPPLLSASGVELHSAMAASSLSFLFTGIVGTWSYGSRRSVPWPIVGWLSAGMIPSAIAGARLNHLLGSPSLTVALGVLLVFSGAHTLLVRETRSRPVSGSSEQKNRTGLVSAQRAKPSVLLPVGVAVGFGSALTGTGGPVLLVPILIPLGIEALYAVGVSQAIQLPIAVSASIGHLSTNQLDLSLGLGLGAVQAIFVLFGASLAHRLHADSLRRAVALALALAGLVLIGRIAF